MGRRRTACPAYFYSLLLIRFYTFAAVVLTVCDTRYFYKMNQLLGVQLKFDMYIDWANARWSREEVRVLSAGNI